MKLILITLALILSIGVKAQFTYFGTTTGDVILTLTDPQKIGTLDSYAQGKSLTYVKHNYAVPTSQARPLYLLFRNVNNSADALMLAYPGQSSYTRLVDSLEVRFADEEIQRNWLDAIMTKKINYCTHPDSLSGLNNNQRWVKYLELLLQ